MTNNDSNNALNGKLSLTTDGNTTSSVLDARNDIELVSLLKKTTTTITPTTTAINKTARRQTRQSCGQFEAARGGRIRAVVGGANSGIRMKDCPDDEEEDEEISDDSDDGDDEDDEDEDDDMLGDETSCIKDKLTIVALPHGPTTTTTTTTNTNSQGNCAQPKKQQKPRRRVATLAQRRAANIRERRRMFNLNSAFDRLRQKVPSFAYEKRLSRIETLKLAIMYIKFMDDLVNDDAYAEKYKHLMANHASNAASSGFLSSGAYLSLYSHCSHPSPPPSGPPPQSILHSAPSHQQRVTMASIERKVSSMNDAVFLNESTMTNKLKQNPIAKTTRNNNDNCTPNTNNNNNNNNNSNNNKCSSAFYSESNQATNCQANNVPPPMASTTRSSVSPTIGCCSTPNSLMSASVTCHSSLSANSSVESPQHPGSPVTSSSSISFNNNNNQHSAHHLGTISSQYHHLTQQQSTPPSAHPPIAYNTTQQQSILSYQDKQHNKILYYNDQRSSFEQRQQQQHHHNNNNNSTSLDGNYSAAIQLDHQRQQHHYQPYDCTNFAMESQQHHQQHQNQYQQPVAHNYSANNTTNNSQQQQHHNQLASHHQHQDHHHHHPHHHHHGSAAPNGYSLHSLEAR